MTAAKDESTTEDTPTAELQTEFNHPPVDIRPLIDGRKTAIFSIIVLVVAVWLLRSSSVRCDMSVAENRDFNRYYGIDGLRNHFTTPTADECNPGIIFQPALPQAILKSDHSASSFLTLASYGTGKTLLRCEYYKTLRPDKYLKVLILNKQIDDYLERYAQETTPKDRNCEIMNCLLGWSDLEFGQLVLSVLATNIINTYENTQRKSDDISINEKMELITILCYYYDGFGTSQLEHFVNSFLNKSTNFQYKAGLAQTQYKERDVYYDKELFTHFKTNLKTLKVLKRDDDRLRLLLAIVEGEQFSRFAKDRNVTGSVFKDLTQLSLFVKQHLQKTAVFIIDGIDENRYFFHNNGVHKLALETFCRSSVSQELLARAMAHNFYLSIFYPKIEGIHITNAIIKKDKFPTYSVTWNTKSLINYADYVLQRLNNDASWSRCKSFGDFKTLVNYSNKKVAETVEKIPTPRALHYFMIELITLMNNDAADISPPFIATFENVHQAYERSYEHYFKWHTIKQ